MAGLSTVSDPTDWKPTKFPFLAPLDAALRCEVCKDFFTAPVITNCCHTFCSLCIRRALVADGNCPTCRSHEQEFRLRKNTTVQDLLDAFSACRPKLYELATKEDEVVAAPKPRRGRPRKPAVELSDDDDEKTIEASPPPQDDGLVPCPICSRRMKEISINSHLDKCIESQSSAPPPAREPLPAPHSLRQTRSNPRPSRSATFATPAPPLEPLPKLTYNLLNEKNLRTKLRDLGISDSGSRKLMQERHTEWVNLWNANVDSKHPQSKRELLAALQTWERAHVKPPNNKTKAANWSDGEWADKNKDDFKSLIEQARRNSKRRKIEPEEKQESASEKPESTSENPESTSVKAAESVEAKDITLLPANASGIETSQPLPPSQGSWKITFALPPAIPISSSQSPPSRVFSPNPPPPIPVSQPQIPPTRQVSQKLPLSRPTPNPQPSHLTFTIDGPDDPFYGLPFTQPPEPRSAWQSCQPPIIGRKGDKLIFGETPKQFGTEPPPEANVIRGRKGKFKSKQKLSSIEAAEPSLPSMGVPAPLPPIEASASSMPPLQESPSQNSSPLPTFSSMFSGFASDGVEVQQQSQGDLPPLLPYDPPSSQRRLSLPPPRPARKPKRKYSTIEDSRSVLND